MKHVAITAGPGKGLFSKTDQHKNGLLLVVSGAAAISFSPVFVKLAQVGPASAGFYRMLIGGLILLAVTKLRGAPVWPGWRSFRHVALCGLFFALDLTFWHRSVYLVGPGLSTILTNCQVFFLAFLAWLFLKETLTWRLAAAIPLALLGLSLLVGLHKGIPSDTTLAGIIAGLLGGLFYSCMLLVMRKMQKEGLVKSNFGNISLVSLVAAACLFTEAVFQGEELIIPDLASGLYLVGYGVICQCLGWILISSGMPGVRAAIAGLLLLLQPTLSFLWDVLFFAKPAGIADLAGAFLALAAIYMGTVKKTSPKMRLPKSIRNDN